MKIAIELAYVDGVLVLTALKDGIEVAEGRGATLPDAVPALVSAFAEMQQATIDALHASGLITYQPKTVAIPSDEAS